MVPSSTNSISPTSGVGFITQRRCVMLNRQILQVRKNTLSLSTSVRLLPQVRIGFIVKPKLATHVSSVYGTDLSSATSSDISPIESKRPGPVRESEMPAVKNEQLIQGATFTGKDRSIQPFDAFIDFGALTDGLVHVSNLSDSFVKDVGSIVSVGQEVTVRLRLIEANMETGRISLTICDSDDNRPPRKTDQKSDETKKTSKFVKGQHLHGTVKNLASDGAIISLPEGEEGFLPDADANIMGCSSYLEVGQEVSVRVLGITRGKITLTTKKEEDVGNLFDGKLIHGVVHTATNPFVLAFRNNEVISAFLDEREKQNKLVEKSELDFSGEVVDFSNQIVGEPKGSEIAGLSKKSLHSCASQNKVDNSKKLLDHKGGEKVTLEATKNTSQGKTTLHAAANKKRSYGSGIKRKMDMFEDELSRIVGLHDLKLQLRTWAKGLVMDEKRRAMGAKLGPRKLPHMVFLGNPGTGKTTVARILGKLLKTVGVLSSDKVIEVQRTDLVGEHIGRTGPKTRKKIQEAMGGTLFVDEAYRLAKTQGTSGNRDFGSEALEEIMSVLEDGNLVVIFAGYTEPMERVFSSNAGFCRRVTNFFQFDDFTCEDLAQMVMIKMSKQNEKSRLYGFKLHPSCTYDAVQEVIENNSTEKLRSTMNGGLVDHMLNLARQTLDLRLNDDSEGDELLTITLTDLEAGLKMLAQRANVDDSKRREMEMPNSRLIDAIGRIFSFISRVPILLGHGFVP